MVDCRTCIYFTKYTHKDRKFLGFCNYWNKPIEKYKGKCRAYRKKEIKQHKLSEYLKGL